MVLQSSVHAFCYPDGFFAWFLVFVAAWTPWSLWAGVTWFAANSREISILFFAKHYWISGALHYAVTNFMVRDSSPPHPECNVGDGAVPPLLIWILYHYMTVLTLVELFYSIPIDRYTALRRVAMLIAVPAVWIWSQNSDLLNAVYAALFGTGVGLILGISSLLYFVPLFSMLASERLLAWFHIVHHADLSHVYVQHPNHDGTFVFTESNHNKLPLL